MSASAREAFLLLFGQGLDEVEARDLIAEAGPLFAEAAYVAAQIGDRERALGLLSEGKARLMAVALILLGGMPWFLGRMADYTRLLLVDLRRYLG